MPTTSPIAAQTFAFITHSPATLPNNLPPNVDNERLARRRRRRTSAHDQAILESEYAKNDRPDRYARRQIADKVELGEKEIQIWFQNRRQTNRRKSKPLQPHEIVPHNSDLGLELSSDPFISSPHKGSDIRHLHEERHDDDTIEIHHSSSRASSPCPALAPLAVKEEPIVRQSELDLNMSDATEPDLIADLSVSSDSSLEKSEIIRKTSPIHFLLNPPTTMDTANLSFQSTTTVADDPEISQLNSSMILPESGSFTPSFTNPRRTGLSTGPQPKLLKRSSSQIRLSMSFDGKATVILEDDTATALSSQTTLVDCSQQSNTSFHENMTTPPKRRTIDAKIWESCVDSQSSVPVEHVTEDSPRKALKTIRARGVVAAAKAAASARKQQTTASSTATTFTTTTKKTKKVLGPKSTNVQTPTKSTSAKPKLQRASPTKLKDGKARKVVTASQKGPLKATPSPPLSAVKSHNRSPFRTLERALSGGNRRNDKPGFTIYQSSEEGDSEKENWDPVGKAKRATASAAHAQTSFARKNGRSVLGDLGEDRVPQPNELEVIENLMSLRDGLWR